MVDLLSLTEDKVGFGIEGLKILIYGGNAVGKTSQSAKFPKSLLLCVESGGSALHCKKQPILSKKDFLETVKQLTDDKTMPKMKELFQTIIIDTPEDLIGLFELAICKEYGVADVGQIKTSKENPDMPNGYSVYRKEFKQQINKLTNCGYTVIFISHEESVEEEYEDEEGKTQTRTKLYPKGSGNIKGSARFIRDLCDFRFYIRGNGTDKEGNVNMSTACCTETDKYFACSRFAIQPFINPFTAENMIKAIEDAQKKSAELENCGLRPYHIETKRDTKEDYLEAIKPYMVKLSKMYKDEVASIIEAQLGFDEDGKRVKVSDATDEQLTELETIYTNLISLACDRGIVVDADTQA